MSWAIDGQTWVGESPELWASICKLKVVLQGSEFCNTSLCLFVSKRKKACSGTAPCPPPIAMGVSRSWRPSGTQINMGLAVASLSSRRQGLPEEVDHCLVR